MDATLIGIFLIAIFLALGAAAVVLAMLLEILEDLFR